MIDEQAAVLMNECYADSITGKHSILSAMEGSYITTLKRLEREGLLEFRGPLSSTEYYGAAFEAKLTALGIAEFRAYLEEQEGAGR